MYYIGAMDNQELAVRVSKYPYTKDVIPGSGNWYYTQVDKKIVEEDDKVFFEDNAAKYYWHKNVMSDDKYTFDGWPLIIHHSINTKGDFVESTGTTVGNHSWVGDSTSKAPALNFDYLQMMGSTFSPTFLYGYARYTAANDVDRGSDAPPIAIEAVREHGTIPYILPRISSLDQYNPLNWGPPPSSVKIMGVKADYVVFDDWQSLANTHTTGIVLHGDSVPLYSSVQVSFSEAYYNNPFHYLEMCGT